MVKISIIIPTLGRTAELDILLESIANQNCSDIEIIIVDQNQDNSINDIVQKYKKKFEIHHEKVNFKGASKARNYGFKKSSGKIIVFPDDDSIMAENTIKFVEDFFRNNKEIKAVFGRVQDKDSSKDILHFKKRNTKIRLCNIYQTTIETSMFIRRDTFQQIDMYDERLGIGTYFGAEEGADLVSRLLYNKTKMMYVTRTMYYHPNKRDYTLLDRAYSYNLGFGALVCKHIKEYKRIYPMYFYGMLKIMRDIMKILIAIITRNKQMFKFYYTCFKGKIRGWTEKRKDY